MTLTSEQLSVVNLVSGRHLVLAPPGSGKTEMLSQRIIRALGSGVDPAKMLCATFTNRAAFEMRDRVAGAAGQDCKLPDVGNLHHFCHRFLLAVHRLHPGKHVLDESQQLDFIREVTDVLREEPNEIVEEYFADCEEDDRSPYPDILSAVLISHQWRLGIPPCYLRQVPPQVHELVECGVIAALERAYSGLKRKFQSVDFDDLVNETFLYHRSGMLRLDAATCLTAQGITCWNGVIRGAATDFVRMESIADAEHEETIRAILSKKDLPDEYERRMRRILLARAKRITST